MAQKTIKILVRSIVGLMVFFLMASTCNKQSEKSDSSTKEPHTVDMKITSTAFENKASIPMQFSCEGANISPELSWDKLPPNTKSLALIVEDPDAANPPFTHWVAWNIKPEAGKLSENIAITDQQHLKQGTNSHDKIGYFGPCPPTGTHRYYFRLFALNLATLNLPTTARRPDLQKAIEGHIILQAELMGTYKKTH